MLILIITKRVFLGTDSGEPFVTLAYEGTNPRLGAIDTDQETALGPWERPRSRGFCGRRGLRRHRTLRLYKGKNTLFYYHGA